MASRDIKDLNSDMVGMARVHMQLCEVKGIQLLIYCTARSAAEQTALYAIGRSLKGKIVTNARAGQSAHNPDLTGKASAYDCVPLIGGKAMWDSKHPSWAIVGLYGEEAGLVWSGRWSGALRETAHFQDPRWKKP